jgi:hypothetical protein
MDSIEGHTNRFVTYETLYHIRSWLTSALTQTLGCNVATPESRQNGVAWWSRTLLDLLFSVQPAHVELGCGGTLAREHESPRFICPRRYEEREEARRSCSCLLVQMRTRCPGQSSDDADNRCLLDGAIKQTLLPMSDVYI